MTTKFTDLTEIAAVDVDDDDVLALSDVSASASRKVTVASLRTAVGAPSQDQATWNTGTDTTESTITAAKLDDKIEDKFNVTGTAPLFGCRAWVNFNGTGTVAIRASGNVASITDNGTGDYTVNFTTAMEDANYCVVGTATTSNEANNGTVRIVNAYSRSTTSCSVVIQSTGNDDFDVAMVSVAIFR